MSDTALGYMLKSHKVEIYAKLRKCKTLPPSLVLYNHLYMEESHYG
jgi:hypothetical protein